MLDRIRGTTVAERESGHITQHLGASEIPIETIRKIAGPLLDRFKIKVEIPGLFFLDSPGHEAFTSLRKRGSSIADLAILVVDITEGFQQQTKESVELLKEFKTPFVVAATKIDKIEGWISKKTSSFLESFEKQPSHVKENLDKKLYRIVSQLSEEKFDSERFDRVSDFKKYIAIVPCSGLTGEGVSELLMILSGLSQQFLKKELEVTAGIGKGSILEVKETRGLGLTIDVILYDGEIRRGDWLVIGGKEPTVTKVKALLKPLPLKELRVEKEFENVDYVSAAAGIKVSAPNLEKVIPGTPVVFVSSEGDIDRAKKELQTSIGEIEFQKAEEGIILKADTLGSLEALINILKNKISIKKTEVGNVSRKDIIEIEIIKNPFKRIIIAFNVKVEENALKEAKDKSIKILQSNIIYKLIEDLDAFTKEQSEKARKEKLSSITFPATIKILPGHTFRASNPAIVGVEVLSGLIKPGYRLQKKGKEIGEIKTIQSEKATLTEAKIGEKVAVSIDNAVVGRHIKEGDELDTVISEDDIKVLEELEMWDEIKKGKEILERSNK